MKSAHLHITRWIALCLSLTSVPLLAQSVSVVISAITAPTGTLSSPTVVIDSDTRNALAVTSTISFTLLSGTTTPKLKVTAQLLDMDAGGTAVPLVAASASSSTPTSFSFNTTTKKGTGTFALKLDPTGDLGSGKRYAVRLQVFETLSNGTSISVGSSLDSALFVVAHFTHTGAADDRLNVRAYATAAPTFTKSFALSNSSTQDKFTISLPCNVLRYDLGGSFATVPFAMVATLTDEAGNVVPLQNGGRTPSTLNNKSLTALVAGTPNTPALISTVITASFEPVAQLNSPGKTYRVTVQIEHEDQPGRAFVIDGSSDESAKTRLLHFNGKLNFGSAAGSVVQTEFAALTNAPIAGSVNGGPPATVNTAISISSCSFLHEKNLIAFGAASNLPVRVQSDGTALFVSGTNEVPMLTDTVNFSQTVGNVRINYSNLRLNSSGVVANAGVNLPQGLSFTADKGRSGLFFESTVSLPNVALRADFTRTTAFPSVSFEADAWVFDETRPLLYRVTALTLTAAGRLDFTAADVEWAHKASFERLDKQQDATPSEHQDPSGFMRFRPTNEAYLRSAQVTAGAIVKFDTAPDGTARTKEAALTLGPGKAFFTHMPVAFVNGNTTGTLNIADGFIASGSSLNQITTPLQLGYSVNCPGPCLGSNSAPPTTLTMPVTDASLRITPDGGLSGDVTNTTGIQLGWDNVGSTPATRYVVHRSGVFTKGKFHAAGNHMSAKTSVPPSQGPGAILYAGFKPQGTSIDDMVYPGTTAYLAGEGHYAGFNFTAAPAITTPATPAQGETGSARLTGMATPMQLVFDHTGGNTLSTTVDDVTRYYVRGSGVTGRHCATESGFSNAVQIYGYQIALRSFELAFLSNSGAGVAEPSRINGSIDIPEFVAPNVPGPHAFFIPFKGLQLDCGGALAGGEIDPNNPHPDESHPEKPLKRWQGKFKPLAIAFRGTDGEECATTDRKLTIMVESGAANIADPLYGSLIFNPDGRLGTLHDRVDGVDGRLGLPATLQLAGPGQEKYQVTPVSKLYFNDPALAGIGYVGFGARMNVPYFEDLKVHITTSADRNSIADYFVTSGWTEREFPLFPTGDTFFSNVRFDEHHRGFPDSSYGVTATQYRVTGAGSAFNPVATQSMFGLIPLSYPLKWSPSSKDFVSVAEQGADLFIMDVKHRVKNLSAKNAEITFGAEFEDVANLNLTGAALAATGIAEAIITATTVDRAAEHINNGITQLDTLISSSVEALLRDRARTAMRRVMTPFYAEIRDSYIAQVLSGAMTYDVWAASELERITSEFTSSDATGDDMRDALTDMLDTANAGVTILTDIKAKLDAAILTCDMIAGEYIVEGNNVRPLEYIFDVITDEVRDPSPKPAIVPGLIREHSTAPGNAAARRILQTLIRELVRNFAPTQIRPQISALLDAVDNPISEVNALLNEVLLDVDPQLDQIEDSIVDVRNELVRLRRRIDRGESVASDLRDVLEAIDVTDMVFGPSGLRTQVILFVTDKAEAARATDGNVLTLLAEFNEEELLDYMSQKVMNSLNDANVIQRMKEVLRHHLVDLQLAMGTRISDAFDVVNQVVRAATAKLFTKLDTKIDGLTGPIGASIGAGKINGYAQVNEDTLAKLRLDADVQLTLSEKMQLRAYFEMLQYDSRTEGLAGPCAIAGEEFVEIRLGATDVLLDWTPLPKPDPAAVVEANAATGQQPPPDDRLRADLGVRFMMRNGRPDGLAGTFRQTRGKIDFQGVQLSELGASVGISSQEAYLAAAAKVKIGEYKGAGGVFFGRTCSLEPIAIVDANAAAIIGQPPFTGGYAYGEIWVPISEVAFGVPATCMFRVSAGIGAGAFYFSEGPTYGGRLKLGLSGEVLCAVTVEGFVDMTGAQRDGKWAYRGTGHIQGKAGECPFCLKVDETVHFTYRDGHWTME